MVHVTIEYMIMVPVLILQIFLFPFVAASIMNTWDDSASNLQLQEISGHLASSIQQLYYTINHGSIREGTLTVKLDIPILLTSKDHVYNYTITLTDISPSDNDAKIMNLTLSFDSPYIEGSTSTFITLGENADCPNITVNRGDVSLIKAIKTADTIMISFEGAA
jgi:hypothetical protein